MIHVNGAGFCDDQIPVLSTIGRGPKGPQGDQGPKGDTGFASFANPIEWDIDTDYPEYTIVLHEGNSYLSKVAVLNGISITNEDYWQPIGNYNAQIEQYRRETQRVSDLLPEDEFDVTVKEYIDDLTRVLPFSTVNDMMNTTNLFVGAIAYTQGFHAINDGGGAFYRIDENGEADGYTTIQCGSLLAHLVHGNTINAKQVGCDEDSDVSAIVNEVTKEYPIFFPAGKYMVSNPIYIQHSIYGEGFNRLWDGDSTEFISSIASGTEGVINVSTLPDVDSIEIKNISIECSANEYGVSIKPRIRPNNITLEFVSVHNCKTYGFYVRPDNADSRVIQIYNCSAWHKRNDIASYNESVGFFLDVYANDVRIDNCDAMGFKIGFRFAAYVVASNLHAYCGQMTTFDQSTWQDSIAFRFSNGGIGTNLYADTAYLALFNNQCTLVISNFIITYDDSVASYDSHLSVIFAGTAGVIRINGGIMIDKLGIVRAFGNSNNEVDAGNIFLKEFASYTDNDLSVYPFLALRDAEYRITTPNNQQWNEFARIVLASTTSGATIRFLVTNQNGYSSIVTLNSRNGIITAINEYYSGQGVAIRYQVSGNVIRFYCNGRDTLNVKLLSESTLGTLVDYTKNRMFTGYAPYERAVSAAETLMEMTLHVVQTS